MLFGDVYCAQVHLQVPPAAPPTSSWTEPSHGRRYLSRSPPKASPGPKAATLGNQLPMSPMVKTGGPQMGIWIKKEAPRRKTQKRCFFFQKRERMKTRRRSFAFLSHREPNGGSQHKETRPTSTSGPRATTRKRHSMPSSS